MQKTLLRAALSAAFVLTLTPAVATAPVASAQAADTAVVAKSTTAEAGESAQEQRHVHAESPRVAPGQERADFHAWLARAPENRASVQSFRDHLKSQGVDDVLPIWQLVRTSSSWRECAAGRFEVAPRDKWDNIVTTLKFIERDVEPVVGDVQAVSGYRNAQLNSCSNGAPASAHRHFFALDLMPVDEDVTRGELVRKVCAAHARDGRVHKTGLGFYTGTRFHLDSNGFRKWGPNGSGATSPCVTSA
jgi:hypothetical protein